MAATAAGAQECSGVFVCDLAPGLTEDDLRRAFGHYGDIVSLEQINESSEEAVLVEYALAESAEEAQSMLNLASLRHKTCRCLFKSSLSVIRQTMDTGQRLIVENLDPAIESRGLLDVCALFGQILDCKVEFDEDRSRGYGFAHFALEEEATKAKTFMDGMQIGESVIEVRRFEAKDASLFTGCVYAGLGRETDATVPPTKDLDDDGPAERERQEQQALASLQAHHLEVIDDVQGKLERLKDLTQLYNPNQEMQMIVIADSSNLAAIGKLMREIFEEGDFEAVSFDTKEEDRKEAIEGFETGNTFALLLGADVATRSDFHLNAKAAVLVNFDFPPTLQAYLRRIFKRADGSTRAHSFFSPSVDHRLAVPLMAVMEEVGNEIPEGLVGCWTGED